MQEQLTQTIESLQRSVPLKLLGKTHPVDTSLMKFGHFSDGMIFAYGVGGPCCSLAPLNLGFTNAKLILSL